MPKRTDFRDSIIDYKTLFIQYLERLQELTISAIEWEGLPDTVDPRYLELALYTDGQAVFFRDEDLGDLALRVAAGGDLNAYGIPGRRRAYGVNGYQHECGPDDSVMIYNNYSHTNSYLTVVSFAKRLANYDRTVDINIAAMKTPVLLVADDKQRMTVKNMYMQYDGGQPAIYGDKALDLSSLKVLKTDAPFIADDVYELKVKIWNEALTYLGISNMMEKKERVNTDEVARLMGGTIASRYGRLEARRMAAEQINRMFDLDVKVRFRDDFQGDSETTKTDPDPDPEDDDPEGGEDDE